MYALTPFKSGLFWHGFGYSSVCGGTEPGMNCQGHPAWGIALEQKWDSGGGGGNDKLEHDAHCSMLDLMSYSSPTMRNPPLYTDTFNWTQFSQNPDLLQFHSSPQPTS